MIVISKKTGEIHGTKNVEGYEYIVDKNNDAICSINSNFALKNFQIANNINELDIMGGIVKKMNEQVEIKCKDLEMIMDTLKRVVEFQEANAVPNEHKWMLNGCDADHIIEVLHKLNKITGSVCYGHLNGAKTPEWFRSMGSALPRYRSKRK
jgi:hypothetical protein